jgi:parallel beta-helix repeat protein/predicted outer membrane repeat protein
LTRYVPDAYSTIQAALDACIPGDRVVVRAGSYTGTGNKNLDFKGKAVILCSEHGPSSCIIDCEGSGRGFYFHTSETANAVVSGFTITNGSMDNGGAIYCISNSTPTITNCLITANTATSYGGGIYCAASNNPVIINNCIFKGNSAVSYGGAIAIRDMSYATSVVVTDCTFSGNSANQGGGIYSLSRSGASVVTNCILWGNSAANGPQLACSLQEMAISFCDVQGGQAQVYGTVDWGGGNINLDPAFVNVSASNLRLLRGSPCIDAANNNAVPVSVTSDLNGWSRFVNDLCTPDTGLGTAPIADMGAYEFLPADINGSGFVDLLDYDFLSAHWLQTGGNCQGADMDCNGTVNLADLAELIAYWFTGG